MNPLAIFTGPYALFAKWGVIAALALSMCTFVWIKGNQHGTQKLIDYQAAQALEAVKIVTKQGAVTERVVKQYQDRVVVRAGATQTIEKEVVKYVDSKPLALACMLDSQWVRLHDAAASSIPPSSESTDGAAGTVNAATALSTITANYARANRNADKLEALQGWVTEQLKATNGP